MIVGALIHDLSDELAPVNHSQLAAAIIRPYVRNEVASIIEHRGAFQIYYFGDAMGVKKTPVKFIVVINGMIVVKNFVNVGIRCHLIPIVPAIRLHILNQ